MPAEASLKPERAGFLPFSKDARRKIRKHRELYLVILIPMVYTIIFHYLPMYGIQIGFRDFNPIGGITGSPFVGLKHFKLFFRSPSSYG